MTRRQLATVLILSGLIVSAGPVAVMLRPIGPHPGPLSFSRVRVGMTREQVDATVGAAGVTAEAPAEACFAIRGVVWEGLQGTNQLLMVRFGPDGRAEHVAIFGPPHRKPTPQDQLRDRFGR